MRGVVRESPLCDLRFAVLRNWLFCWKRWPARGRSETSLSSVRPTAAQSCSQESRCDSLGVVLCAALGMELPAVEFALAQRDCAHSSRKPGAALERNDQKNGVDMLDVRSSLTGKKRLFAYVEEDRTFATYTNECYELWPCPYLVCGRACKFIGCSCAAKMAQHPAAFATMSIALPSQRCDTRANFCLTLPIPCSAHTKRSRIVVLRSPSSPTAPCCTMCRATTRLTSSILLATRSCRPCPSSAAHAAAPSNCHCF